MTKKALGAACTAGNVCTSGNCVDGACCSESACSPGTACTAHSCATGSCTAVDKSACALSACELVAASCTVPDGDGDGLSDAWETNGYIDVNCNGKFDDGDVSLPGADPNKPDIYVLYDWLEFAGSGAVCANNAGCAVDETCTGGICVGDTHDPEAGAPGALAAVAAQFAARGINLHIIRGHGRPHSHVASFRTPTANCEGATVAPGTLGGYAVNFFDIKNAPSFPFDHGYDRVYHYVLFAHYSACDSSNHCAACTGVNGTSVYRQTGQAEISGNDVIVSLGNLVEIMTCPDDRKFTIAGTFMHELGHNLGLRHGGGVDPAICIKDSDCDALGPDHAGELCRVWNTSGGCTIDSECAQGQVCLDGTCSARGCVHACAVDSDCTGLGSQHFGEVCAGGLCRGNEAEDGPGYKPNYLSVMNYRYQMVGVQMGPASGSACPDVPRPRRLDYSVQILPTGGNTPYRLDESQLDETAGLGSGNGDYFSFIDGGCVPDLAPANGPVDWDGSGLAGDNTSAAVDLNPQEGHDCGDVTDEVFNGHADWGWASGRSMFTYRFQCAPHFVDGAGAVPAHYSRREMSVTEAQAQGKLLPERAVSMTVRPGHKAHWIDHHSPQEVPVVVYGAKDFDVEQIDVETIRLGRAFATSVAVSDVDGDGFADLTATFVMSRTGFRPGTTSAAFSARLANSQVLLGKDSVVIRSHDTMEH